jgi:hypothetical protein
MGKQPSNTVLGLGDRDIRGGVELEQPHGICRGHEEDQVIL